VKVEAPGLRKDTDNSVDSNTLVLDDLVGQGSGEGNDSCKDQSSALAITWPKRGRRRHTSFGRGVIQKLRVTNEGCSCAHQMSITRMRHIVGFSRLRLIEALLMMDPPQGIMGLKSKVLRSVGFQQAGDCIGLHDELGQAEESMADQGQRASVQC